MTVSERIAIPAQPNDGAARALGCGLPVDDSGRAYTAARATILPTGVEFVRPDRWRLPTGLALGWADDGAGGLPLTCAPSPAEFLIGAEGRPRTDGDGRGGPPATPGPGPTARRILRRPGPVRPDDAEGMTERMERLAERRIRGGGRR